MKRDLKIRAAYAHPPELVWEALTDPDDIAAWLMPNDFKAEVGHEFTLRTDPAPGFDGIVHCKVLEIDPLRRLSYTWKGGPVDTVITFELERVERGTVLHVTQSGFQGFKAVLVSLILGSGSKKIYNRLLPAVLDRKVGKTAAVDSPQCDEGGLWRVLAAVFSPILGAKEGSMRTLIAAVVAGVVLFVFNAMSWMALPFHGDSLNDFPKGAESFLAAFPESGAYHFPGQSDDEDEMNARLERAKAGPVVSLMIVSKEGIDMMAPSRFVMTLLLDIAAAFLAALVLRRRRGGFGARLGVMVLLGTFLAVGARGQDWLWWSQPMGFAVAGIVDAVLGWTIAGAVLAAIVRPASE